ncbi:hypothetical protein [Bacillus haynesii]|uniref:hypothetical protein n=1 Tax=Bacillus haynesii TaxID=1925021 RepID=UPI001F619979|nr:hypothetical protein [Bacillus haynesii]MCI4126409.1 hypothetical protein [Bacillus haynesii]
MELSVPGLPGIRRIQVCQCHRPFYQCIPITLRKGARAAVSVPLPGVIARSRERLRHLTAVRPKKNSADAARFWLIPVVPVSFFSGKVFLWFKLYPDC